MYCLNDTSSKLTQHDLNKIHSKLNIFLKDHQNTIIKAMLNLEETNKICLSLDSKINKQEIILKEDLLTTSTYYDSLNIRRPYLIQANIKDFKTQEFIIELNYGILADKVGAGKTYDILGLISHTLVPKNHPKIISSSYYSMIKYIDNISCINTNLIIVPHNLILQWKQVLASTNINYFMVNKKANINSLQSKNILLIDDNQSYIENYEVIIISATMLDSFYTKFQNIKWARIVIDEVVSINLPVIFEIKANFIWYITATPSSIKWIRRNYIREMINGIQRCIFNKMIIKNDDNYVSQSMSLQPLKQVIIHCNTPKTLKMIKEFIPSDVMSMLNAGNVKEAILKLNCNVDTNDNIVKVITNKLEKDIHNANVELQYLNNIIPNDQKSHDESIKKLLLKIEGYKTRDESIKQKFKDIDKEDCPICLSEFNMPCIIPCCNNLFCFACLANVKNKCPMCRSNFFIKDLHIIDNITIKRELLSKKDNLLNILKKKPDGKFLIFSSYENTNDNISKLLDTEKFNYSKLAGNCSVINKTIEKFVNGTLSILLLNAAHYGSGLNLQMATDIIIYHEMDLELETQVIGRAQRLGRTTSLNVYYLLHDYEKSNCNNPTLDLNIYDDDNKNIII
jgi:hypothetical protein